MNAAHALAEERGLSLEERAYRAIRARIIEGAMLEPQSYTETELAELVGVSRTPVREALKRLRAEQVIELRPKGGVWVKPVTPAFADEVYTIRALLEGHATGVAATRIDDEGLRRLREIALLVEHNYREGRRERLGELYGEFHARILAAAQLPLLEAHLEQLETNIQRFRRVTSVNPAILVPSREEHVEIIDALERRDAAAAERAAYLHVIRLKDAYVGALREQSGVRPIA
ncbi:MAG TPA: GntR family transcriptional regulator [Candidatus Limnocylindria bacterium]|jgi:DNA-binding GntR family transcriptional regulator|nr:GntR family transcriptional regulator [Candidatus Limnocylindria bacterium]